MSGTRNQRSAVRVGELKNTAVEPAALTIRASGQRPGPTKVDPADREFLQEPKLTVGELAHAWRVEPETIWRDIRKGALRAYRLPGGDLRILLKDAREYGRPVD
jgi:hypothetical protein